MADPTEILQVIKILRAASSYQPADPATLLDLWTRKLAHLRPGLLTEAADIWVERNRFFPAISEILDRDLLHFAEIRLLEKARLADPFAQVHPLIAEKFRLLDAYWTDGALDPARWQSLIARFTAQGCDTAAADLAARLENFQQAERTLP